MGLQGTSWPWVGRPEPKYDEDAIEQAFVDVLLTGSGERKMNPEHGSQLLEIVFENKGRILDALARREISRASAINLTLVEVRNIDIKYSENDDDPVDMTIYYEYQGVPSVAKIQVPTS